MSLQVQLVGLICHVPSLSCWCRARHVEGAGPLSLSATIISTLQSECPVKLTVLAKFPAPPYLLAMSKPMLAGIIGISGFLLYVAAVIILADHVLGTHWTLEFIYFALAGIVWVWPAKALIIWAAR